MRTKIFIVLIGIIAAAGVFFLKAKTRIDWSKMQAIDFYNGSERWKDFERMKDVDLNAKAHTRLNLEQAKQVFDKAETQIQVMTVWKEYKYAVAYFDGGKPLRLQLSSDDGFFLVLNFGRKYQVPENVLDEWNKLWNVH